MKLLHQLSIAALSCFLLFSSCDSNNQETDESGAFINYVADSTLPTIHVTAETQSSEAVIKIWDKNTQTIASNIMEQYALLTNTRLTCSSGMIMRPGK